MEVVSAVTMHVANIPIHKQKTKGILLCVSKAHKAKVKTRHTVQESSQAFFKIQAITWQQVRK